MRNLLLLNDWEIGKALQAVVLLQAAVLISLYMAHLGLGILIVQVPISFVYLTFVPGILILRILKLHELGNVRTLLYSTGLSLSFLMAVGFFMNAVFPKIGLTHPVSFIDLAAVLTSLVLILCVLSYVRDKEFSNPAYVQVSFGALSPQLLLLALLPFATILATVLMNSYGTNALQMVLLLIIMAIPFFVCTGSDSAEKLRMCALRHLILVALPYGAHLIVCLGHGRHQRDRSREIGAPKRSVEPLTCVELCRYAKRGDVATNLLDFFKRQRGFGVQGSLSVHLLIRPPWTIRYLQGTNR